VTASSGYVKGIRGVQIGPGATALTRIPFSASICKAASETLDGSFGRRIGEKDRIGHVRIDGRCIDDRGAGLHVRNGCLGEIEHGMEVDREGHLPLVVADVSDVLKRSPGAPRC
jgi:hypothetical protein